LDNALERGAELQEGLRQLGSQFPGISAPRGKGLMVGVDILDREGQLSAQRRDVIVDQSFYHGLLLLGCGKAAIRFCPPLVIDADQIQTALTILATVLAKNPA
jgi:4-aminobutyrate aminotransferase